MPSLCLWYKFTNTYAGLWHFDLYLFRCYNGFKLNTCIIKLSSQACQQISHHVMVTPPTPLTFSSSFASQAPITTDELHQQAITVGWECDTFHKSLSWEIAFLYPAQNCVWREKTGTHLTKAQTRESTYVHMDSDQGVQLKTARLANNDSWWSPCVS